jgi:hypothetical protein
LIHDYIDQPKYSKACASLDDGFEDAFQYTVQGNSHNRLKSTNLIERLNQEVRRREKIIRIFPNQTSANRLIGAVLMDLHDEWIYSSRKYINFDKVEMVKTLYSILHRSLDLTVFIHFLPNITIKNTKGFPLCAYYNKGLSPFIYVICYIRSL